MPSLKPRLALTLPEHRHDLLKRLAALQGVSMASVVTELLEECYPVLERVVVALEVAKTASESARAGLRESCDKAMAEIEPYRDASLESFDRYMGEITRQAGEPLPVSDGKRSAAETGNGSGAEGVNPRVVTRGSGIPTPPPPTPARNPRKGVSK